MVSNLEELFKSDLKYMYDAEKQLSDIMPDILPTVRSSELKDLLQKHVEENKTQMTRLENISQDLGVNLDTESHVSEGMEGLQKELKDLINKSSGLEGAVLDAALIAALQRIQHYEIASYGTLRTYADLLGNKDASSTFQDILDEESEMDQTLTDIALHSVNPGAKQN